MKKRKSGWRVKAVHDVGRVHVFEKTITADGTVTTRYEPWLLVELGRGLFLRVAVDRTGRTVAVGGVLESQIR